MEDTPAKRRRPGPGFLLAIFGGAVLVAIVVAMLLHEGNDDPVTEAAVPSLTAPHTVTATPTVTQPPAPADDGSALAVFTAPRDSSDALPGPLLEASKTQSIGGGPRVEQSRLVTSVDGVGYYIWPIGKQGLCSGLGDARQVRCTSIGPGAADLDVALAGTTGTQRHVAGVVGRNTAALTVKAPGLTCSSRPERSGFVCVGPAAEQRPVTVTIHLRDGSSKSQTIG